MKFLAKTGITRLWLILLVIGLSMVTGSAVSTAVSIGENYGGGIVFYVDKTGQHGLISSRTDMAGHSEEYPEGYFTWADAKAECYALNENGYTDWYLPNKTELNKLYLKRNIVGGFLVDTYWSSTASNADIAWLQAFRDGSQWDHGKPGYAYRVRAIRAF